MTKRVRMWVIPVEQAVGARLSRDVTRIVPGGFKGPAFRKGHIIRPEDIPNLLEIGKEHIYVLDLGPVRVWVKYASRGSLPTETLARLRNR